MYPGHWRFWPNFDLWVLNDWRLLSCRLPKVQIWRHYNLQMTSRSCTQSVKMTTLVYKKCQNDVTILYKKCKDDVTILYPIGKYDVIIYWKRKVTTLPIYKKSNNYVTIMYSITLKSLSCTSHLKITATPSS